MNKGTPRFAWMFAGLLAIAAFALPATQATAAEITMYKAPNCGCCSSWGDTLKTAGFTVVEIKHDDMDVIKQKYGVSDKLASCHTALIGGYIIEGHVPAADIQRLLKEKPKDVVGLTAPGMPQQSPGMQPDMLLPKNYDVLAFDKEGNTTVYSHY